MTSSLKTQPLSILILCISVLYLQESKALLYTILTLTTVAQIIKMLNDYALIPDPDYFKPISKNKLDPQEFVTFVNRFSKQSRYLLEEHVFQTKDGHNLMCFKVSQNHKEKAKLSNKKSFNKPVLLIHGWGGACFSWLFTKNSVGYYYIEQGYDTWFANIRGTLLNQSHRNPKISAEEFFDYTIHDHALKDMPCFYENILKFYDDQKLIVTTFSLASLMIILALSDSTTSKYINENTEAVILLASLSFTDEIKDPYILSNPMKYSMLDDFLQKSKELGIFHYKTGCFNCDTQWQKLNKYMCNKYQGFDYMQSSLATINRKNDSLVKTLLCVELEWIPFMFPFLRQFGHSGNKLAGGGYCTSAKCTESTWRMLSSDVSYNRDQKIFKYDYGTKKNKEVYGTEIPPQYDLTKINVPMRMIQGSLDGVSSYEGALSLANLVNKHNKNENIKAYKLEGWTHLAFSYIKNNEPIKKIIEEVIG